MLLTSPAFVGELVGTVIVKILVYFICRIWGNFFWKIKLWRHLKYSWKSRKERRIWKNSSKSYRYIYMYGCKIRRKFLRTNIPEYKMHVHHPGSPFGSWDQWFTTGFGRWGGQSNLSPLLPPPNPDPFCPILIFVSVDATIMLSIWGLPFLVTSGSSWSHSKISHIIFSLAKHAVVQLNHWFIHQIGFQASFNCFQPNSSTLRICQRTSYQSWVHLLRKTDTWL